jgi:hypothetical protein
MPSSSASLTSDSYRAVHLKKTTPGSLGFPKSSASLKNADSESNDLSAVALDVATGLPRFNMPLELGLLLGCKRFGSPNQSKKRILVLDRDQYRYRAFISDISGQDIRAHAGEPERAIREVRDWLSVASNRARLPGGAEVIYHYHKFRRALPGLCAAFALEPDRLTFTDLLNVISDWLEGGR